MPNCLSIERRVLFDAHLYEDSEVDDDDGGSEEEVLLWEEIFVEQRHEREGDCSAQTTVRHDKLVNPAQRRESTLVSKSAQQQHSYNNTKQL